MEAPRILYWSDRISAFNVVNSCVSLSIRICRQSLNQYETLNSLYFGRCNSALSKSFQKSKDLIRRYYRANPLIYYRAKPDLQ